MSLICTIASTTYNMPYQTTGFGNTFAIPFIPSTNFEIKTPNLYEIFKSSCNSYSDYSNNSLFNNSLFTAKKVFGKDYAEEFREKTKTASNNLISLGYNKQKGEKLANIAIKNTVGFTGDCATYVKNDIKEAGLGEYAIGDAHLCDDILRKNPNFKEISTNGLDLKNLPAGCILVYEKGVAGYSSTYGHIEITDGQGGARSDGKTCNIRPGAKVFIPV